MMEETVEFSAPWGRMLKGISTCVILIFVGIAFAGRAGTFLFVFFPLILVAALPFMVRGYVVTSKELIIKRSGWSTRFSLAELRSVEINPEAMKGTIRLCGNGGLFSFTGLYRNKELGNFRAFVNDLNRMVVLHFEKRVLVISPDDPSAFLEALHHVNPLSSASVSEPMQIEEKEE